MSTEALLTILSLLVAVYAVLPQERRLDLRLRLGVSGIVVAAAALIAVHWIKFRTAISELGLPATLGPWRLGLTDETGSYLILLGAGILIAVLVRYGRLTRSQLPQLTDLLTRLLAQRRFPEAIHLLDKHVDFLIATHSKAPFLIRLRKRLAPRRLEDLIALVQGPNGTVLQRNDLFWDPISRLADRVLPTESRAQNVASNLIRRVWTNEALVAHLASATPALA